MAGSRPPAGDTDTVRSPARSPDERPLFKGKPGDNPARRRRLYWKYAKELRAAKVKWQLEAVGNMTLRDLLGL